MQTETLANVAIRAAMLYGSRSALVDGERRMSFEELADEAERWARAFLAQDVAPGERVALWMGNRLEWVAAALGAWRIGAIVVPLNTRYRADDFADVLGRCGAQVLVCADRCGPVPLAQIARAALDPTPDASGLALESSRCPRLRSIVVVGGSPEKPLVGSLEALERGAAVPRGHAGDRASVVGVTDPALILFTSGTTGAPRGVLHDHRCLDNVADRANRLGVTQRDVVFANLPYCHIYGLSESLMCGLVTGAAQIIAEHFDAESMLDTIARSRVTVIHGFETHYRDLLQTQRENPRDLSSLRIGTLPSGQATTALVARDAQRELCPIVTGYGMTETWAFATTSFLDSTEDQRCAASGFPSKGMTIEIVDPDSGALCPSGVAGEIRVKGKYVMEEYFENPEATAAAFDPRGRLKTGDLGMWRDDGHLRFIGRIKDMLKVGGENVSPSEIEAELERMTGVAQAAVVGIPDVRLVEIPVAFVRARPREPAPDLAAVDRHFRGRVASFKIPRHVFVVERFPMTESGKIQKAALRTLALSRLDTVSAPGAAAGQEMQ